MEEENTTMIWKTKKMIENLNKVRGNGTSLISLIIPPKEQISIIQKMLIEEYSKSSNIKSRIVKLAVQDAITSTQQRLKLFNKIPENGLIIYSGLIIDNEGKEKRITYDLEPIKKLSGSFYRCDNIFHTEPLCALLETKEKYGFIIMDGNGCLYGFINGNNKEILYKFTVELPKKHGRGGQSSLRFERLRKEKRHNYLRKCAELSTSIFITDNMPNVSGLIVAGSADFKSELSKSDFFDPRLHKITLKVIDISYGGENGFNQAIDISKDVITNLGFIKEKKIINEFFTELQLNPDKIIYGISDTIKMLENATIEKLIVWDQLSIKKINLIHPITKESHSLYLPEDKLDKLNLDISDGLKYNCDIVNLIDWLVDSYSSYHCKLFLVSNKSQEGSQFCNGFGGLGGILKFSYKLDNYNEKNNHYDNDNNDDNDNLNYTSTDISDLSEFI